jgi:hypothetical protein
MDPCCPHNKNPNHCNKCKEEEVKIKVKGRRGDIGPTGAVGQVGPTGATGQIGATGPIVTTYSPILFSGYFVMNTGGEASNTSVSFGSGVSNQTAIAPVGVSSEFTGLPVVLPTQFNSSIPLAHPNDVYYRVPGSGPRLIRGLRWSIEYAKARSRDLTPIPAIVGIWAGAADPSAFVAPSITKSALVDNFTFYDPGANVSSFQQGANLADVVAVNGGDYIALVLNVLDITPDITIKFLSASAEISNST